MKLRDIFAILKSISESQGISTPYLCGGVPRDKILGLAGSKLNDIDITTGDASVKNLAKEFQLALNKNFFVQSRIADDGHITVFVGDLKIDFSSNFKSPQIDIFLKKIGKNNPTELDKETLSRDFTCNALLMDLDLKKIKDPTNFGIKDIQDKIIRTCLPPDITLKENPKRIIRVIYLSSKLGFSVDPEIVKWIKNNKELIRLSGDEYLTKKINKSLIYDTKNTIKLLNELDIWEQIPISKELQPYYNDRMVLAKSSQLFTNYDYVDLPSGPGTSIYSDLKKYKSVSEFRKKRRNKRKKILKKIRDMKLK